MSKATKGTIPFVEKDFDLKDPSGTAQNFAGGVLGIVMLFGATALARTVWNRISQTTDAVSEVEVF